MGMFKFPYVKPEEFNIRKLLTPGPGTFEVKEVIDAKDGYPLTDKNGCEMLRLVLRVKDSKNQSSNIDDYLTGSAPWRIKDFAEAVGVPGLYNPSGAFEPAKLKGLSGECLIKTDSYTGKDGKNYESSKIADYLPSSNIQTQAAQDTQDEIPF